MLLTFVIWRDSLQQTPDWLRSPSISEGEDLSEGRTGGGTVITYGFTGRGRVILLL